jgi:hypothetical protein
VILISIIKNNQITNQASFSNERDADLWLNEQIKNNSFGERGTYKIKVEYK